MASDSKNPFHVPSDEEVFALREEEAARKRQEREQAKELHVWEKGVKKNRAAELLAADPELEAMSASLQQSKLNLVAAATRDRRKEKEHMGDFIAKKREMFLVQMSLDTKRAEIRKLEERAQQREEVRAPRPPAPTPGAQRGRRLLHELALMLTDRRSRLLCVLRAASGTAQERADARGGRAALRPILEG